MSIVSPSAGLAITQPLVSVGLPTYNRHLELTRAAESVLAQSWPHLELVISDNASEDGTDQVCARLARTDPRVRYVRQSRNRGPTENFWAALHEARGQFFMWLGDDDWLEDRNFIATLVDPLAVDPDYAIVAGLVKYYRNGRFLREGQRINLLAKSGRQRVRDYFRQVTDNGTFYGLMRRADALTCGLDRRIGNDWLFVASLALLGKVLTLESIHLARESTWDETSFARIAAADALSPRVVRWPHLSLCASVFSAIAWGWPRFRTLPLPSRVRLALVSQGAIFRRFIGVPLAGRIGAVAARALGRSQRPDSERRSRNAQ